MLDSELQTRTRRKRPESHLSIDIKIEHILDDIDLLHDAFPDGPIKHREAHEAWIAAKEAEKNFYDNLKLEIMKKGVTGTITVLVIILGLALTGFGHQLIDNGFFSAGATGGK